MYGYEEQTSNTQNCKTHHHAWSIDGDDEDDNNDCDVHHDDVHDDKNVHDDGNVEGCHDDGDGGIDCGEQLDDNNGPFAPYDDDLLRDIIAFINGKGSL